MFTSAIQNPVDSGCHEIPLLSKDLSLQNFTEIWLELKIVGLVESKQFKIHTLSIT